MRSGYCGARRRGVFVSRVRALDTRYRDASRLHVLLARAITALEAPFQGIYTTRWKEPHPTRVGAAVVRCVGRARKVWPAGRRLFGRGAPRAACDASHARRCALTYAYGLRPRALRAAGCSTRLAILARQPAGWGEPCAPTAWALCAFCSLQSGRCALSSRSACAAAGCHAALEFSDARSRDMSSPHAAPSPSPVTTLPVACVYASRHPPSPSRDFGGMCARASCVQCARG